MSGQFNKDYGDYFSAVQKSVEKETNSTKNEAFDEYKKIVESTQQKDAPVQKSIEPQTPPKKFFGGVIRLRAWVYVVALILVAALVVVIAVPKKPGESPTLTGKGKDNSKTQSAGNTVSDAQKDDSKNEQSASTNKGVNNYAKFTDKTKQIPSEIESQSIIVINCETNKVVAARNARERCYPASTTKIMTILTACDYITDYNKTFTFSYEITDPLYVQEATMAGFADGESVTMTDMLYGAILPSGADATVGLALSIAGSEEDFVKLMNKKAKELGLKNTHFTNSSGLFDDNHYTTAEDMAVIVRAAMKNDLCRKILSTYQYTTAATPQHPEGILLTSTLFSHMYGTEPEGSDILGGKTGFVNESGYCIASFGKSDEGTEYVCVTLKGVSVWPTTYDQIDLYSKYAK